jgi:hypothetical protein
MAYDSKDDRGNNPASVLRRAGVTTKRENDPGQGWLESAERSVSKSNRSGNPIPDDSNEFHG